MWSSRSARVSASIVGAVHQVTSPPAMAMPWPFMLSLPGLQSQSTAFATSAGVHEPLLGIGGDQRLARLGLAARRLLADVADGVAHDAGVGVPGADRVHGDAGLRDFERERARHADQAVLRRAVGRAIGIAAQARRAGHVDDAAPVRREHGGDGGARAVVGAGQVDVEHHAPESLVALRERAALRKARVVDEDRDLARRPRAPARRRARPVRRPSRRPSPRGRRPAAPPPRPRARPPCARAASRARRPRRAHPRSRRRCRDRRR